MKINDELFLDIQSLHLTSSQQVLVEKAATLLAAGIFLFAGLAEVMQDSRFQSLKKSLTKGK